MLSSYEWPPDSEEAAAEPFVDFLLRYQKQKVCLRRCGAPAAAEEEEEAVVTTAEDAAAEEGSAAAPEEELQRGGKAERRAAQHTQR